MSARHVRLLAAVVLVAAVAGGCSTKPGVPDATSGPMATVAADGDRPQAVVRLAFAGDVMLGRRVAPVVASDGPSIFEGVRLELSSMDLALANLESPFGDAVDSQDQPPRLVADPAAAALLGAAGFDAVSLANNHAGDAGPNSVPNTAAVLSAAGVAALGTSVEPVIIERSGLHIALLAFDATGQSPAAHAAHWDPVVVEQAVRKARASADLVAVSVHGGVEYMPRPDRALRSKVEQVAAWGADVVWAHGAHVAHDVVLSDSNGEGRISILAYGLGNFLFDQHIPGTTDGRLLEVIAAADGVRGYRIGVVRHVDLRVSAPEWQLPAGDAAWLDGGWWSLATTPTPPLRQRVDPVLTASLGEVTAASIGDVDGDGDDELVAGFVRPLRPTLVNQRLTDIDWTDSAGRSAHVGVYEIDDRAQRWVAGSLPRVASDLAVCDGAIALAFRDLDGRATVATSAWWWRDFGFATASSLPGPGVPACLDVDADSHLDPVLLRTSARDF